VSPAGWSRRRECSTSAAAPPIHERERLARRTTHPTATTAPATVVRAADTATCVEDGAIFDVDDGVSGLAIFALADGVVGGFGGGGWARAVE
jgi:hypothetical protein